MGRHPAYVLHVICIHVNRDYRKLQPASPGYSVTSLLSCLPRKPLDELSQLTELFVQLLHKRGKVNTQRKNCTPLITRTRVIQLEPEEERSPANT